MWDRGKKKEERRNEKEIESSISFTRIFGAILFLFFNFYTFLLFFICKYLLNETNAVRIVYFYFQSNAAYEKILCSNVLSRPQLFLFATSIQLKEENK